MKKLLILALLCALPLIMQAQHKKTKHKTTTTSHKSTSHKSTSSHKTSSRKSSRKKSGHVTSDEPVEIEHGPVKIDSLYFYNSFSKEGTTNGIRNDFEHPDQKMVDFTHSKTKIDLKRLIQVLNTAKRSHHSEQKITGIDLAGDFYDEGVKHHFIVCGNTWIVDMTTGEDFIIKDPIDQAFLSKLISK
jgi:hypothetical protein